MGRLFKWVLIDETWGPDQKNFEYTIGIADKIVQDYWRKGKVPLGLDEIGVVGYYKPLLSRRLYRLAYTRIDEKNFTLVSREGDSIVWAYPGWSTLTAGNGFTCCFGRGGYKNEDFWVYKKDPYDNVDFWP